MMAAGLKMSDLQSLSALCWQTVFVNGLRHICIPAERIARTGSWGAGARGLL